MFHAAVATKNPRAACYTIPNDQMEDKPMNNTKTPRRAPAAEGGIILLDTAALAARDAPNDNYQRRLCDAIARYGVTRPLTVRAEGREGRFVVVDGARRLAAARACGLASLPCRLETTDDAPPRLEGTMFEQAERLSEIIARRGWTQQETAARLGVSQSTVANKLRLLKLSADERAAIERLSLSERHARALLAMPAERRREVIEAIERRGLTVAATEALIEQLRRPVRRPAGKGAIRDIGIFYNSIDRALSILHEAGIEATIDREEYPDGVTVVIRVSRETSA